MKKWKYIIAGIFSIIVTGAFGQADINTATHWYNRSTYNPASISRPGFIYLFTNARRQWVGIDGSPSVYTIQASGFSEELNSAFGFSMVKDDIGLTSALNPTLLYAYRVGLKENLHLSLGLSLGAYTRTINGSAYEAEIVDDPVLDYTNQRFSSPDANVGFELQAKHFLLGLSVDHLFSIWKPDEEFLITNHQYAYVIYRNSDSEMYNFTGGIQVSRRNNLTIYEATAIMRFKHASGLVKGPTELFDLGITYRSVQLFTLIAGINITPKLRVGYTYDFDFSDFARKNGTHEIVLEYRIPLRGISTNNYPWYD